MCIVMNEEKPELKISLMGVILLLFFFIGSVLMIYIGYQADVIGLVMWGYVFLLGASLSLLVVVSKVFALRMFVKSISEEEERKVLEEKIKQILKKYEAKETETEKELTS